MKLKSLGILIASMAALLITITARAELLYAPDTCQQGYVWREAFPGDHVCVTPKTRTQAAADNRQAAARREPDRRAYGPDTCQQGYVWREAFPDDRVCVTPEIRAQAAEDNSQAEARREPDGGAYGPNTCRQGYVWREARPEDLVCVTPETRTQTAEDNSQAEARREPDGRAYGSDTCRQGYVWREARPEDHVCVTPKTRDQTAFDNSQAEARRASAAPPKANPASQDKIYNQPRYMDERLDWCLTWGANCGKPAAVAFCHRRRFEDVVVFRAEVVGKSAPTRLLGSNQVCRGDKCTAFAYITCTSPIDNNRVFANPTWKDYRLDVCLQWGANCGKPAADAFCKTKGFSGSLDATPDAEPGYAETRLIGTDQICNQSFCRGFQQIICK